MLEQGLPIGARELCPAPRLPMWERAGPGDIGHTRITHMRGEEVDQHKWEACGIHLPLAVQHRPPGQRGRCGMDPRSARCWGADVTRRWASRQELGSLGPRKSGGTAWPHLCKSHSKRKDREGKKDGRRRGQASERQPA